MKRQVELNEVEWGQVLDGLTCRVVLYEETVGYYEHGVTYGHIADVNGADEAKEIAEYYRDIIWQIENQLGARGYIVSTEDFMRNCS